MKDGMWGGGGGGSAHLLTVLPLFLIALTLILSK